jgi:hypothetical protein
MLAWNVSVFCRSLWRSLPPRTEETRDLPSSHCPFLTRILLLPVTLRLTRQAQMQQETSKLSLSV